MHSESRMLKYALFATGLAGIVAEYILSTLASYFLGDSIFQWTIIVSTMLFSMGFGSRLSKYLNEHLLERFIFIEFILSILTSFSAILVYYIAAFTEAKAFFIYLLAILIGMLIGMEIPLVTRLNDKFEELRINIASVLEKDYYGSLLGGLFFAFVGLPILGLTYTPFLLGAINFLVAVILFLKLKHLIKRWMIAIQMTIGVVSIILIIGTIWAEPILLFGEQAKYKDKIVYQEQSRYQKIVITQWKENYWLYLDARTQLSSLDEWLYHEPLVHPAMELAVDAKDVLVFGGGDGCAVREVLKHSEVNSIILVDLDPAMTDLGKNHPVLTAINDSSLHSKKVSIVNNDAYAYLETCEDFFDVVIADLPDPRSIELGRLYSYDFYKSVYNHLRPNGAFITQATSPYYSTMAFRCIDTTMQEAGFNTARLHNQILTFGEWGWIIGSKQIDSERMKNILQSLTFNNLETKWLNTEAMHLMTSFGKPIFKIHQKPEVNTLLNPVLYQYYMKGNWDTY